MFLTIKETNIQEWEGTRHGSRSVFTTHFFGLKYLVGLHLVSKDIFSSELLRLCNSNVIAKQVFFGSEFEKNVAPKEK